MKEMAVAGNELDNPIHSVRRDGDALIAVVVGDVDVHRSWAFQRSLMALLDQSPQRIILDLADVSYMDSSGLAGLIKLLSQVRRLRIDLWLCRPTVPVRSLLEITRLDQVFSVADSLEEALSG